jgi:hypothetical protein
MNGEVRPYVMPGADVVAIACPPSAEGALLAYVTAAGDVRWGIDESETPRPQCEQPAVGDASGNVYFASKDDDGNYIESRASDGGLRWRSDQFGGVLQRHLVLGFDSDIYALVFDGIRSRVIGFSSSDGSITINVELEGSSHGLYPNADGLGVALHSAVSYYSYGGELQRHTDRPTELVGVGSAAGGADGRAFLAGYSDSCARPGIARISPKGLDWVWQGESGQECSHTGLAATPNGVRFWFGIMFSSRENVPTTFVSVDGNGATRWTRVPTEPAESTDNVNYWTPPVVDKDGKVMLPSNYNA